MQSFLVWSYTLALVNLDRRTRIIEVVVMSSTRIHEYYYGRLIGTQLLVILKTGVLYFVAAIFFGFSAKTLNAIFVFIILILLSNCLWFNIGFILGFLIKNEDIRDIVMQLITLPLTFLSNIYYPTENLTGILRTMVYVNPLTHATTAIRTALLAEGKIHVNSIMILGTYAVITTILVFINFRKHQLLHD